MNPGELVGDPEFRGEGGGVKIGIGVVDAAPPEFSGGRGSEPDIIELRSPPDAPSWKRLLGAPLVEAGVAVGRMKAASIVDPAGIALPCGTAM